MIRLDTSIPLLSLFLSFYDLTFSRKFKIGCKVLNNGLLLHHALESGAFIHSDFIREWRCSCNLGKQLSILLSTTIFRFVYSLNFIASFLFLNRSTWTACVKPHYNNKRRRRRKCTHRINKQLTKSEEMKKKKNVCFFENNFV